MQNDEPALNTGPEDGGRRIYSVGELNRAARSVLEGSFPNLWVEGEVSNLARPASGHLYFSLKDAAAQVRCALFKNRALKLATQPENGMQVLVRAEVSLYEGRGEFQLIVEYLEPAGAGALQRAFEALKKKLDAEGLFRSEDKQLIPIMPKRVGVMTSPSGAAIRDILSVLKRRYPGIEVIIYPVPVQGAEAPGRIRDMLAIAEQRHEVDVLILTRGGGSLEDLWAFNDEQLARAIHASSLPTISAVGHEIDFTIADFVADQRAATPSAAAEMVSPSREQLIGQLQRYQILLARQINQRLNALVDRVVGLERRLPHPVNTLQQYSQRLDDLSLRSQRAIKARLQYDHSQLNRMTSLLAVQNPKRQLQQQRERCRQLDGQLQRAILHFLEKKKERLMRFSHNLDTVSPLATLGRGYAIVQKADGAIVRNAMELAISEDVNVRFGKGDAILTVKSTKTG